MARPFAGMNPWPSLLRASAWDAGQRSMNAAGRRQWNDDDWNIMCAEQDALIDACYGQGPLGRVRFGFAEGLQKAGRLTLTTRDYFAVLELEWSAYQASFATDAA